MEISQNRTTKLFVGNIPRNCTSQSLRTLFETMGRVSECDVVKDYAFVHYVSPFDAEKALKFLDGTNFQGCNLRIQVSHSKVRCRPGMGDKDVCYRCGREGHWSKDCYLEKDDKNKYNSNTLLIKEEEKRKDIFNNNLIINTNNNILNGNLVNNNITINTINNNINATNTTKSSLPSAVSGSTTLHTAHLFFDPQLTTQDTRFNIYDRKPELPITFSGFSLEFPTQTTYPPGPLFSRDFSTDQRPTGENILFNSSNHIYPNPSNPSYSDPPPPFPAPAAATAVNISYPLNSSSSFQQTPTGIIGFDAPGNHIIQPSRFITQPTNHLLFSTPESHLLRSQQSQSNPEYYSSQRLRTPIYGMEINGGSIDISSYLESRRF